MAVHYSDKAYQLRLLHLFMHSMYYFCASHVVEIFSCVFHHQIDTHGNLIVDEMKGDELKFAVR